MMKEKIRKEMSEILAKDISKLGDEVEFSNLGVDSFTLINLVIELQDTFNVRLSQEDLASTKNIGMLLDLISSRVK